MLVVIFGAGASYDAVPDYPPPLEGNLEHLRFRFPLSKDLFQNREIFNPALVQYPDCGPIISDLRMLQGNTTVEHQLEVLRDQRGVHDRRYLQLIAIRYYLRYIMLRCTEGLIGECQGITNYARLLDRIALWLARNPHEQVRFISFNYDTLLEEACRTALGLRVDAMDAYVTRSDYRVYKPHGSVNWAHVVENPEARNSGSPEHTITALGKGLQLAPDDYRIHPILQTIHFEDKKPSYPAIALPVETKAEFECPETHQKLMQEDLRSVTKLLIIGWRATEQHFLKLWTKDPPFAQLKAVGIVAGRGETESVQQNLEAVGIGTGKLGLSWPSKWFSTDLGFSHFLGTDGLTEFLGT